MSTTTKPIPLFGATDPVPAYDRLRGLMLCNRCQPAPYSNLDTHPIFIGELQAGQREFECSSVRRLYYFQAAAVAALVALRRAIADDELSRPLELPDLKAAILCHDLGHLTTPFQCRTAEPTVVVEVPEVREEAQEAEPTLEYHWSRTRRKVRAAAKAYSEQTHADY
jgi:hypothetical protein